MKFLRLAASVGDRIFNIAPGARTELVSSKRDQGFARIGATDSHLRAKRLDVRDGVHFLLAGTGQEMSAAIAALMDDLRRRSRLVESESTLVQRRYWEILGERLVSLYSGV
jgi:hypothetical protein